MQKQVQYHSSCFLTIKCGTADLFIAFIFMQVDGVSCDGKLSIFLYMGQAVKSSTNF